MTPGSRWGRGGLRLLLPLCLAAALGATLVACSDDSSSNGDSNSPDVMPLTRILARAFPGVPITLRGGETYTLGTSQAWQLRELGPRLPVGPEGTAGQTAFFTISGSGQVPAPYPGLTSGTYAALASPEEHGLFSVDVYALSADATTLLPLAQVSQQGSFQQGTTSGDSTVSIVPAFTTDIEPDGRPEMVLARQNQRGDITWIEYTVYQRTTDGRWQLLHLDYDDTPVAAVLEYWANVSAGVGIATRWDPETRLEKVWAWLSDEKETVTPNLVSSLSPSADAADRASTESALTAMRNFFELARVPFSPAFAANQPWPGFISAFRHTEAVTLEGVDTPDIRSQNEARITSTIAFAEREGGAIVTRHFKTTFQLERQDGRWLLHKVKAEQVGKADVDTGSG